MRTIPRLVISLAMSVAPLVPSVVLAQDSHDVRRGVDFSRIKTFAFKETPPIDAVASKTTTYDSAIIRDRTNTAIAAQLQSRGMVRNDENPDVYIVTQRSFETEYTYAYGYAPYAGFTYGRPYYGPGWGWYGWGWNGADIYAELKGTLTVDMVDSKTGALLWRGVETKHVHQTSKPEKRERRVVKEVNDVFEHFPYTGTGIRIVDSES